MGGIDKCGGIVLCGGRSRRMGRPKADLPFGPEAMLQRVVRLLRDVVEPIVVVAARGQQLPKLPTDVAVVHDRRDDRGPLEGLAVGLAALEGRCDVAYATGCDVPLLVPDFVRRMIALAQGYDAAVPRVDGYQHPLSAVYRLRVRPHVERLLAADRLRHTLLVEEVHARVVEADELVDVDPALHTLRNCNRPAGYLAALTEAGFEPPADLLAFFAGQSDKRRD